MQYSGHRGIKKPVSEWAQSIDVNLTPIYQVTLDRHDDEYKAEFSIQDVKVKIKVFLYVQSGVSSLDITVEGMGTATEYITINNEDELRTAVESKWHSLNKAYRGNGWATGAFGENLHMSENARIAYENGELPEEEWNALSLDAKKEHLWRTDGFDLDVYLKDEFFALSQAEFDKYVTTVPHHIEMYGYQWDGKTEMDAVEEYKRISREFFEEYGNDSSELDYIDSIESVVHHAKTMGYVPEDYQMQTRYVMFCGFSAGLFNDEHSKIGKAITMDELAVQILNDDRTYGVRSLAEDEDYDIGDICRESYGVTASGESKYDTDPDAETIGTCATGIPRVDGASVEGDDIENTILHIEDAIAHNRAYGGKQVIIAGTSLGYGQDPREVRLENAEVIAYVATDIKKGAGYDEWQRHMGDIAQALGGRMVESTIVVTAPLDDNAYAEVDIYYDDAIVLKPMLVVDNKEVPTTFNVATVSSFNVFMIQVPLSMLMGSIKREYSNMKKSDGKVSKWGLGGSDNAGLAMQNGEFPMEEWEQLASWGIDYIMSYGNADTWDDDAEEYIRTLDPKYIIQNFLASAGWHHVGDKNSGKVSQVDFYALSEELVRDEMNRLGKSVDAMEPKTTVDQLRALLMDEQEAIIGYGEVIAMAEGNSTLLNVLSDIMNEEKVHAGQLQALIDYWDEHGAWANADGIKEGKEQIDEVTKMNEEEKEKARTVKKDQIFVDAYGEYVANIDFATLCEDDLKCLIEEASQIPDKTVFLSNGEDSYAGWIDAEGASFYPHVAREFGIEGTTVKCKPTIHKSITTNIKVTKGGDDFYGYFGVDNGKATLLGGNTVDVIKPYAKYHDWIILFDENNKAVHRILPNGDITDATTEDQRLIDEHRAWMNETPSSMKADVAKDDSKYRIEEIPGGGYKVFSEKGTWLDSFARLEDVEAFIERLGKADEKPFSSNLSVASVQRFGIHKVSDFDGFNLCLKAQKENSRLGMTKDAIFKLMGRNPDSMLRKYNMHIREIGTATGPIYIFSKPKGGL